MVVNEIVETEELNKKVEEVQDPQEAVNVIKDFEDIIQSKKKGIISIGCYQGKVLQKFKEREKFITLVNKLNIKPL